MNLISTYITIEQYGHFLPDLMKTICRLMVSYRLIYEGNSMEISGGVLITLACTETNRLRNNEVIFRRYIVMVFPR